MQGIQQFKYITQQSQKPNQTMEGGGIQIYYREVLLLLLPYADIHNNMRCLGV